MQPTKLGEATVSGRWSSCFFSRTEKLSGSPPTWTYGYQGMRTLTYGYQRMRTWTYGYQGICTYMDLRIQLYILRVPWYTYMDLRIPRNAYIDIRILSYAYMDIYGYQGTVCVHGPTDTTVCIHGPTDTIVCRYRPTGSFKWTYCTDMNVCTLYRYVGVQMYT